MKKIAIISILLLSILGLSFQYMKGQNRKLNTTHQSTTHNIDGNKESYSKSDENGTIEIERKNGQVIKLVINGKLIPKAEFSNYSNMINQLLSEIPEAPIPPIAPIPPSPPMPLAMSGDEEIESMGEAEFEKTLEVQSQERKEYFKEMYEEKAKTINEAIKLAQSRKHQ